MQPQRGTGRSGFKPGWQCDVVRVYASSWPLAAFHTRAVWSRLALTMCRASGENAASSPLFVWPGQQSAGGRAAFQDSASARVGTP